MPGDPDNTDLIRFLVNELGVDGLQQSAATMPGWTVTAPLWVWRGSGSGPPAKAAWYFLTIDGPVAVAIREAARRPSKGTARGFGSVRVTATIGTVSWQTLLFPSKNAGGYLLPVKADVRRRAALVADQPVVVSLSLV